MKSIEPVGRARVATLLLAVACWQIDASDATEMTQRAARTRMGQDVVQVTRPSDTEIVLVRTFAAPSEAVFAALTQCEHLVHWMQPPTMELVDCETDVRIGGGFRYVFERPGGLRVEVRGQYTVVDAPHRVVHKETYDFSSLEVDVTTALDEDGAETVFRQTLRYPSKQERDDDFEGVVSSAAEAYRKLNRYLEELAAR